MKKISLSFLIIAIVNIIAVVCLILGMGTDRRTYSLENPSNALSDVENAAFNSKFTTYAGSSISGGNVKQLINIVNKNNIQHMENDERFIITIYGDCIGGNGPLNYEFEGILSNKYQVKVEIIDNLVSNIIVKNKTENSISENYIINNSSNKVNSINNENSMIKNNSKVEKGNSEWKYIIAKAYFLIPFIPYILILLYYKKEKKKILNNNSNENNNMEIKELNKYIKISLTIIAVLYFIISMFLFFLASMAART